MALARRASISVTSQQQQRRGSPSVDSSMSTADLQRENATLKAMLKRAVGPSNSRIEQSVLSCTAHMQTLLDRKEAELRRERERRHVLDTLLSDAKVQHENAMRQKDVELRKTADLLAAARTEMHALRERVTEDSAIIAILKKENFRLTEHVQEADKRTRHMMEQAPALPALPELQQVRAARVHADVPSLKHLGNLPPALFKKAVNLRAHSPSSSIYAERSSTIAGRRALDPAHVRDTLGGTPSSRGTSPGASSSRNGGGGGGGLAARQTSSVAPLHLGDRCLWRGIQGVVRYIGPVEGLGTHVFAGVELLHAGYGDHDGSFHGVQYFQAPENAGVFCSLHELLPPRDFPNRVESKLHGSVSRSGTPRTASTPNAQGRAARGVVTETSPEGCGSSSSARQGLSQDPVEDSSGVSLATTATASQPQPNETQFSHHVDAVAETAAVPENEEQSAEGADAIIANDVVVDGAAEKPAEGELLRSHSQDNDEKVNAVADAHTHCDMIGKVHAQAPPPETTSDETATKACPDAQLGLEESGVAFSPTKLPLDEIPVAEDAAEVEGNEEPTTGGRRQETNEAE